MVADVHVAAKICLSRHVSHDCQWQGGPNCAGQVAVIPYADFTYFILLLYVAVPTIILGLFGRAGWRWALLVTTAMLVAQYQDVLHLRAHFPVREIWLVLAFALWQWLTVRAFARAGARAGWLFYGALGVSLLPLAITKVLPVVSPKTQFGFLGISYVTFRALDIVFCLRDGVIATPGATDLFMFLFFFPTISAGPIDRYRRKSDRKSTRLNSSHMSISYAVFCLKKKT